MIYSSVFGKKVGDKMEKLRHFRFWCQKVIPLVYDDSLSYYEVLCKVVHYLNMLISDTNSIIDNVDELRAELKIVQDWIKNFDTTELERMIEGLLLKMIIVALDDNGYIVFYIPETWDDITFNTTGLDIIVPTMPDYGHLVLSY